MEFGVLGPLLVRDGHREVVVAGVRRRALLCALVARAGVVVPAERLVAELWEEPPAAATLASHVAHLRRVIGAERVVTRPPGYVLVAEPDEVDASRFEAAVATGREALRSGDAAGAEAALARGLGWWRGPALADVRDMGWATGHAARLEELRASATEGLLEARLALGRAAEVVEQAEAALAEEPLRERLWALLMLGLYRQGRQSDALEAYRRLRGLLGEELGVEPNPAVRALQTQILTQDPQLDLPVAGAPAATPALPAEARAERVVVPVPARLEMGGGVFVGRGKELALLQGSAEVVEEGRQRVVLVSGEPGAGKTRLCARLAGVLSERGWGAAYGRCEEGLAAPYRPWAEALGHVGAHLPEGLVAAHVADHGTDVVLVAPALARVVGRDPPPRSVGGPVQQGLLLDAVAALLGAAAAEQPLLVVLDDLQWADEATLLLLRHLAQGAQRPPLLVVAVCQDTVLPDDHPLHGCVAQLHREEGFTTLHLGGLGVAELAELAAQHAPDGDVGALAAALHRDTGGNPFYAIELLRHHQEPTPTGDAAEAPEAVPDSVRSSIGRRAARLGEDGARLLEVAAVVGHDFSASLLASAVRVGAEEVLTLLEAAEQAALVRLLAGERFAFAHGIVRGSLYARLGAARRARLHRSVAEALDALPGADPAERARHWLAGAPGDLRATAAAEAAGDAAMAAYAYADAITWYAHAIQELDRAGAADPRGRAELLVSLGVAYRLAGRRTDAQATLAAAAQAARELGAPAILARAALGLAGYDRVSANLDPVVHALMHEALAALGDDQPRLRAALCARVCATLVAAPADTGLETLADQAETIAAELHDPAVTIDALTARLHTLAAPWRAPQRLDTARRLGALVAASRDAELALVALEQEISALLQVGEFPAARAAVTRYAETAARVGIPAALATAAQHETCLHIAQGRFAEAERSAAVVFERLTTVSGEAIALGDKMAQTRPMYWMLGRLEDLLDDDERFHAQIPLPPAVAERVRMEREIAAGDTDAARERLDTYLAETLGTIPQNALLPLICFDLTLVCLTVGGSDRARVLAEFLAPCAGHQAAFMSLYYFGSFDFHLGVLHGQAGDDTAARTHLEAALRHHRAFDAHPWVALTEHALGRLLVHSGDPDERARGDALVAAAADTAKQLGMADPATLLGPHTTPRPR